LRYKQNGGRIEPNTIVIIKHVGGRLRYDFFYSKKFKKKI
jgi:hypothetical protein